MAGIWLFLDTIKSKIERIVVTAEVDSPTRFHQNCLRTVCIMLYTDKQTELKT